MQTIEDQIETIHLYVVRKEEKKPYTLLPLLCAFLCLLGIAAITLYSAEHPYYEHQRLTVAAEVLPLKIFTAQAPIIPTGIKTYPARTAHGVLTITNGSVISQTIPQGFRLGTVVTDTAVFVPAGSANGYGFATVAAHALVNGKSGNIAAYAINQVEGSSVYIRNLSAFSGGRDGYSVKVITAQDRSVATSNARNALLTVSIGLHYPCSEVLSMGKEVLSVSWRCQILTYHIAAFYHVTGVRIIGKNLLLAVWFVARPIHIWVK